MRSNHERIMNLWSDPTTQFIGVNRANGYVTLEHSWYLTKQSTGLGSWPVKKSPVRWWQRADNSQTEEEIPNIKSVSIDRDISQDAATCSISLNNQWMKTNFAAQLANELGYPGYFTFNRGRSAEARSRWQHEANSWVGKIVPGALLRTYQGYGGHGMTRQEAIDGGYITLTGCWIVDDVTISAKSGLIELNCRDMMSLLIDQIIYPPLIPSGLYPLRYQRWVDTTRKIGYKPKQPSAPVLVSGTTVPARYETSSVDAWYGSNYTLHGHKGTDSIDGSSTTYALGEGNSGPDKPFATSYWQYTTGGAQVGAIRVNCWKGGYTMYVSVMENGRWAGSTRVPYDESSLYGTQPTVVDTHADIPYIKSVGCPADTAFTVNLPRVYRADRIRISFRHLYDSNIGPWEYRAGVREFRALTASTTSTGTTRPYGWGVIESHPTLDGYWTQSYEGKIQAFGQCFHYGDRYGLTSNTYIDMAATIDGLGYWVLNTKGQVAAFGNAVDYGSYSGTTTNGIAIQRTHTGLGYWIIFRGGTIASFGDAPVYANVSLATGAVVVDAGAMKDDYGLWILDDDGFVHQRGAAPDYGEVNDFADFELNHAQALSVSPTQDGFIISGFAGWVSGYGEINSTSPYGVQRVGAVTAGYDPSTGTLIESVAINYEGTGYWALNTDGNIYPRGDVTFWGSPGSGIATTRRDGNYKDYAEIIKDLLLWSGFWLKEDLAGTDTPQVYGNIESTGIFSPDPLPQDMFDKKPVIDPINQIKEIVGYISWVDDEGAFRWECVDDQTEALTRRGWVSGHEMLPGDEVLGLNRETGRTEWVPVDDVARYDVQDEDLVRLQGRAHSSLTTSNHRWWVTRAHDRNDLGRWRTSNEITTEDRIPIAAPRADAPTLAAHSDEFVELVAWWYTEGTIRAGNKCGEIYQSHSVNPDLVDRIRTCFEKVTQSPPGFLRNGHEWRETRVAHDVVAWRFKGAIFDALIAVAPDRVPTPEFLSSLTETQAKLFVDTSVLADGHTWGGRYSEFVQKDERRVRAFEMACCLAGRAFRTRWASDREIFRTKVMRSTGVKPAGAANIDAGKESAYGLQRYTGMVWCPKMQRHHVWLARRDGTVFFTGNSPNWWQSGNFWDTGGHTDFIPEIDERIQLTDYRVRFVKDKDRSEIIITTDEPTAGFEDTVTTRYVPSNSLLRGMNVPAMIKMPNEVSKEEQEIMAELIGLHLWFARRVGNITCVANPALQINDQVRIFERVTSETFVHYIRGISSSHDFDSGQYMMDITTNWLGTEDGNWAITSEDVSAPIGEESDYLDQFTISSRLLLFAQQLVKAQNLSDPIVLDSTDVDQVPVDDGSASGTEAP